MNLAPFFSGLKVVPLTEVLEALDRPASMTTIAIKDAPLKFKTVDVIDNIYCVTDTTETIGFVGTPDQLRQTAANMSIEIAVLFGWTDGVQQ